MDAGEEPVGDEDLIEQSRGKARRIHRRALITAAAITALALVFPSKPF